MKVSVFRNSKETSNPYNADIKVIYKSIKDGKYGKLIEKIRHTTNDGIRRSLKESLPSICFSGTFSVRKNEGLIQHSGLVAQDFDHVTNYDEFWENIISDKHTFMAFRSPSGDGVKVIVKIPPSAENHERSCIALRDFYSSPYLNYFKDVSRICFISHDPDIYLNENSLPFEDLGDITPGADPTSDQSLSVGDPEAVFERLVRWLENTKEQYYKDGNKYHFLVHLSAACCRFGLPKLFAVESMWTRFASVASPVDKKDYVKVVNNVYKEYGHKFGTAILKDNDLIEKIGEKVISEEVAGYNVPDKDIITAYDIKQSMIDGFRYGYQKGTTTYFPEIDSHWTWKKGEVTLMGGIGNHGKTTLILQLCLVKSFMEGTKWAVFSPEQNPPNEFYNDLIHTYIGKNTEKQYANQMREDEYLKGIDFVNDHFFFVYPKDDSPTPDYINGKFVELIVKYGVEGCIIDPFNMMENNWAKTGREDSYISGFLSKEKRFALQHQVYKIIIAHPKGTVVKKGDGNYDCPNIFDFAGGATWSAKVDNILQTYRPLFSTDPLDTEVKFISQKIKKQKLVGFPGETTLRFDRVKNRFYSNGYNPLEPETQQNLPQSNYFDYTAPGKDEEVPF